MPSSSSLLPPNDRPSSVETWQANHRLLLQRIEQTQQICQLRGRYLQWALDEIHELRLLLASDADPDADLDHCRMYRVAHKVAELTSPLTGNQTDRMHSPHAAPASVPDAPMDETQQ